MRRQLSTVEATAREAGLGELEVRREHGSQGSPLAFGVLLAAIGAVLVGLSVAGLAGEVIPVVGVIGVVLALFVVYTARKAGASMTQFLVWCVIAVLLAAPSFALASLDEDSPVNLVAALVMAAALIAAGAHLVRRARTGPGPLVEGLALFAGGIVYASADLDGGRPMAFPWSDTALEEAVTPVHGTLHSTVTFRRTDGYWLAPTFDPTRRVDRRLLRRIHEVMAAGQAGPLVEQMRAGRAVVLGGALRGTADALGGPPPEGSPGRADALPWRDITGFAFDDHAFIVNGKRHRTLRLPAQDVRDVGVLKAVIATMAEGEPAPRRSDVDDLRG